jgi:hypothetical protein
MLAWISFLLAAAPLWLTLDNLRRYRAPAPYDDAAGDPAVPVAVSVLIPARNEAANIGAAAQAVLASRGVTLELIVLDDGSTDATPQILAGIDDARLRVIAGSELPSGWSGKQHACAALARVARHDLLVFVDADVRLAPDALSRMAGFMQRETVALASGFPRQITRSWSEILLLPLIHFLLLGFLPMARMQRSAAPAFGAGCGQLFIARAAAYRRAGGHGAIRASLHDGVTLPRAFRAAGFMTGLFDATDFAACRMYENAGQVWEGLTKNATEGMAKPFALPIWTLILAGGGVAPFLLLGLAPSVPAAAACFCCIGQRLILAWRFRQPVISALLHPVGVTALLVVQFAALLRAAAGRPATWRGRAYPAQG